MIAVERQSQVGLWAISQIYMHNVQLKDECSMDAQPCNESNTKALTSHCRRSRRISSWNGGLAVDRN